MRVLQVHNHYQEAGGEDAVVAAEHVLLKRNGRAVHCYAVTNDAVDSAWAKVRTAWQAPYSQAARKRMREAIKDFTPDGVHIHNFFPLLALSIYNACRDAGVTLVQTLLNYRSVCERVSDAHYKLS